MLAGKGRLWIPNGSHSDATYENSVVTIGGRDIPVNSPGRMIDFRNTPLATFSCGDAAPAWNWEYKRAGNWGSYTAQDAAEGKIAIPQGIGPFSFRAVLMAITVLDIHSHPEIVSRFKSPPPITVQLDGQGSESSIHLRPL